MIKGTIRIPGDKSMSHRSALFSAIREGKSEFTNFNLNDDCSATLECLSKMGVKYTLDGEHLIVWGKNIKNWTQPKSHLDAQNSGTAARLISGILAALHFETTLIGDESLTTRPMKRIIDPLELMGADIESNKGYLPMTFKPVENLIGIDYKLPMASAQVKSAVLIAGLFAKGKTTITETKITRDHTERMLGLTSSVKEGIDKTITVDNNSIVPDVSMRIPGKFSSAAFLISAALIIPHSKLTLLDVSLNPSRIGYLSVLKDMGAKISTKLTREKPEPIGDIFIEFSELKNITILAEIVPNIIDEIPILAIVATQSHGKLVLRNAKELRVKESDRINTIVENLRNLGIEIEEFEDGFILEGPQQISGGSIFTKGDHRIAMAFAIANLISKKEIIIDQPECASVSFPEFYDLLKTIQQ